MTLEEVIAAMLEAEEKGLTTVRLHTGDPCLYGAVREQMDMLEKYGIHYDSCPGVSAAPPRSGQLLRHSCRTVTP